MLIDGLCNHMKPAINRMKQGVFTENQYIDFWKKNIPKFIKQRSKRVILKEELHIEKLPEGDGIYHFILLCSG